MTGLEDIRRDESMISVPGNAKFAYMQRIFPFQYGNKKEQKGRSLPRPTVFEDSPSPEIALADHHAKYTNMMCGLLFDKDGSESCFPVTPVTSTGTACWMSCQHAFGGPTARKALSTALDVRSRERNPRNWDLQLVSPPMSPTKPLMPPNSPDRPLSVQFPSAADIAIFKVTGYGSDGLDKYTQFFVPTAKQMQPGDLVACIGYPGKPVDAATLFTTQHDYERYCLECEDQAMQPMPPEQFQIDGTEAAKRLCSLDDEDGLFLSHTLSASPGEVIAANDTVIEHGCSTLPQMSGSPCVVMDNPYELVGIHIKGDDNFLKNRNYCVSVNHPRFVQAYVGTALRFLAERPNHIFAAQPGALNTLLQYLKHHEGLINDLELSPVVAAFQKKFGAC